ncbi:hypothetical protein AD998_01870 [bacterium 336/3]|nr:hypothetical protein AD998_01870 [bacterium 336/3]
MALSDFFRINMPYGMKKNSKNEWFVFNREYMPLGWNSMEFKESIKEEYPYDKQPIYTKYEKLTDEFLKSIITNPKHIIFNEKGNIESIFFYSDVNNPSDEAKYWNEYFEKIKKISVLIAK